MNDLILQWSNKSNFALKLCRNVPFILKLLWSPNQRKHISHWVRSLEQNYLFNIPSPWLVFDAIDYIKPHLFKGVNIFEYGSGGSTLFWLHHGASVVSIEHDPQWYKFMSEKLLPYESIDYRLITPEKREHKDQNIDPVDPEKYTSMWDQYKDYHFYNYVSQIDPFPDQCFDIISIDGRSRPSCIKHSVSKVKIGGLVILDNSDRKYYFMKTEEYLKNFSKIEFYGSGPQNNSMWKTNVYMRIK